MTNDGVFLNPDSGDIMATGQISASQIVFPNVNDLLVNDRPFVDYISGSISTSLSDYYSKSETSSATQISIAVDTKVNLGAYVNNEYNLYSSDLSVVKIAAEDYYRLVSARKELSNVIYILSSDNINAHGKTIIKVADPELSTDAATKNYVDTSLFGRLLSTDLSFNYDSSTKYIHLKAFNNDIGTVNCSDFIKDEIPHLSGMQFDISTQQGIINALSSIIVRFGGSVVI